jgi:hypothetical protein
MVRGTEPDLDRCERRPHPTPANLILRVEPMETGAGEWRYRASYPELRNVWATAPKVLDAILEAEAKLSRYLDEGQA